jgi:hypothetical protein
MTRSALNVVLVAALLASCGGPVGTGVLIERYSAAGCVPVTLRLDIGPPTRVWDSTLRIREGQNVHVSGMQMPGGRIDVKYSSDGHQAVAAYPYDYIYPEDVRVNLSRELLYVKANGERASNGKAETWLFEYSLRDRRETTRLLVDPNMLPPVCAEPR